jgi:hypothetical protein
MLTRAGARVRDNRDSGGQGRPGLGGWLGDAGTRDIGETRRPRRDCPQVVAGKGFQRRMTGGVNVRRGGLTVGERAFDAARGGCGNGMRNGEWQVMGRWRRRRGRSPALKGWAIVGCRCATSIGEREDPLLDYGFVFWSLVWVSRWLSCSGGSPLCHRLPRR